MFQQFKKSLNHITLGAMAVKIFQLAQHFEANKKNFLNLHIQVNEIPKQGSRKMKFYEIDQDVATYLITTKFKQLALF